MSPWQLGGSPIPQKERRALEAQLGQRTPGGQMTTEQLKALVVALRDIVGLLADADEVERAAVDNNLGVTLNYSPDGSVAVKAQPRGVQIRVGGGT